MVQAKLPAGAKTLLNATWNSSESPETRSAVLGLLEGTNHACSAIPSTYLTLPRCRWVPHKPPSCLRLAPPKRNNAQTLIPIIFLPPALFCYLLLSATTQFSISHHLHPRLDLSFFLTFHPSILVPNSTSIIPTLSAINNHVGILSFILYQEEFNLETFEFVIPG